jgi:hypothetical protein
MADGPITEAILYADHETRGYLLVFVSSARFMARLGAAATPLRARAGVDMFAPGAAVRAKLVLLTAAVRWAMRAAVRRSLIAQARARSLMSLSLLRSLTMLPQISMMLVEIVPSMSAVLASIRPKSTRSFYSALHDSTSIISSSSHLSYIINTTTVPSLLARVISPPSLFQS